MVGGEEVGGEAADFGDFPHLRCLLGFSVAGRQRISATSPFTLPFRLLTGFKGNGFRRVSLFALPFIPAPRRGGNEFQPLPPFTLPFRLLAGFKGNGFRRVSLFTLLFSPPPR